MVHEKLKILTLNSGSSSIKFALYDINKNPEKIFSGKLERIGLPHSVLTIKKKIGKEKVTKIEAPDFNRATRTLIEVIKTETDFENIDAAGHRIVHGMQHTHAEIINDELMEDLRHISDYDPDHLPAEIKFIQLLREQYPALIQVACFDTAFHAGLPRVAKILPIPRRFDKEGVQRYGFHGLSYAYIMEELEKKGKAGKRIILAHLGSGASLAAVRDGKCIDTTMGFTPAGGTVMGTRSGDLDPGVSWYMMKKEEMSPKQFNNLINHESGLLGVSEISSNMEDLLLKENDDIRAKEAVDLFCYSVKKWIGAFAAALGGVDTLVFSGGIGENASIIRFRICNDLEYLGIKISNLQNSKNEFNISEPGSAVKIFVVPTDEELMIAKITTGLYKRSKTN